MSVQPSNVLTYVFVFIVGLLALGFLFLLFGQTFVVAVVVLVGLSMFAGLHYVLWGRAMFRRPELPDESREES